MHAVSVSTMLSQCLERGKPKRIRLIPADTMSRAVHSVLNENYSVRQVAARFNIKSQTLTRYVRRQHKNPEVRVGMQPNYTHRQIFSNEEELNAAEYLQIYSRMAYGLTTDGMHPFNPDTFTNADFLPSAVTDRSENVPSNGPSEEPVVINRPQKNDDKTSSHSWHTPTRTPPEIRSTTPEMQEINQNKKKSESKYVQKKEDSYNSSSKDENIAYKELLETESWEPEKVYVGIDYDTISERRFISAKFPGRVFYVDKILSCFESSDQFKVAYLRKSSKLDDFPIFKCAR
ncbi:hypothetical protein ILUMI_18803 [Ignelater luminosus]|uniref:HTH psq-type domain-containing protein n=1 Tax=Ignelater luminosus TaxID=2038154 RepID=A0A8K0G0I7_IGNLU|nr:hypothetical protein ILUMI_18803 [Ignelater luminosus]